MFDDFVLPIFPEGSLASSVITTVWVGVFVISFFNLRFGWVLSGLVVPGYLAPLIIAKPWSALVVTVEAAATYFLVWLFSEKLSGSSSWSSVFGRDRFMALVLASISVRLCFDGWLLPELAAWLNREYSFGLDWRNNLHSFGLVIISLFANQLWKPGFVRGMFNSIIIIAITTLFIRYGLMEFTNFRISSVSYLYEGLASSILASPKAYIILVLTAFFASQMNLRYGWEFNGILIPALIALQWYQPYRIIASFVEAFVIYGLAALVLKARFFADVTMEGARKVLLFFNISFVYKLALGHALGLGGFDVRIIDYYGFGYLLSTLIAIKMFDKSIMARLSGATLQISFAGAAAGSVLGFLLLIVATPVSNQAAAEAPETARVQTYDQSLDTLIAEETMQVHGRSDARASAPASATEVEAFRTAIEILAAGGNADTAARYASAAGYQIFRLRDNRLAIVETGRGKGRGAFVLARAGSEVVLVVDNPVSMRGLTAAARQLFMQQNARALAIAGSTSAPSANFGGENRSFVRPFLEALRMPALVLRAKEDGIATAAISGTIGTRLDLVSVERAVGGLRVEISASGDSGTLALTERQIERLADENASLAVHDGPVDELLKVEVAAALGTAAPARIGELAFVDAEILRPLLGSNARGSLRAVANAARAAGYQITLVGPSERASHVLLAPATKGRKGRGVYLIRLNFAQPVVVQVPRVQDEGRMLARGVTLYDTLNARTLMVAQTDLARTEVRSLFHIVTEATLRAAGDAQPLIVQARAMPTRPDGTRPDFGAIIAFNRIGAPREEERRLFDVVRKDQLTVGRFNGGATTAGYEVGVVPQALQLAGTRNTNFAVVWYAPQDRPATPAAIARRRALYDELDILTVAGPLPVYLRAHEIGVPAPAALTAQLADFAASRDPVALRKVQIEFATYRLEHINSPATDIGYIAVLDPGGRLSAVFNPVGTVGRAIPLSVARDGDAVTRFEQGEAAVLLVGHTGE